MMDAHAGFCSFFRFSEELWNRPSREKTNEWVENHLSLGFCFMCRCCETADAGILNACQEAPYGFATQGVEKLQHFWGDVNLSDYANLEQHSDAASKTSGSQQIYFTPPLNLPTVLKPRPAPAIG